MDIKTTFSLASEMRGISTDWDSLISKQDTYKTYKTYEVDMRNTTVPLTRYLTGSTYEGDWDNLGMTGYGTYTFPHGVEYKGNFRDGEFHGQGTLTYPMGQKVHGVWENGNMLSWSFQFKDGLEFDSKWNYCKYPDRRFFADIRGGLNTTGKERLTNDPVPRKIPTRCYDAGDGFYHTENKCIVSVSDEQKILSIPSETEANWIVKNCRKAWDETTGRKKDLYPAWTTGRKSSTTNLQEDWSKTGDEDVVTMFTWA